MSKKNGFRSTGGYNRLRDYAGRAITKAISLKEPEYSYFCNVYLCGAKADGGNGRCLTHYVPPKSAFRPAAVAKEVGPLMRPNWASRGFKRRAAR